MRRLLLLLLAAMALSSQAQDIIVTESGETIKAYNVEIGPSAVFYQTSPEADAAINRMAKKDIMIIRKADGTKIDPNSSAQPDVAAPAPQSAPAAPKNPRALVDYPRHEEVTAQCIGMAEGKKGAVLYAAQTPDGGVLNYEIISDTDVAVAKGKKRYTDESYIIPEHVVIDGKTYNVTEIGEEAFWDCGVVKEIQFPYTLKVLRKNAFAFANLNRIILNDGVEVIERNAFRYNQSVEVYIPTSVREIENSAFLQCTKERSYNGYSQGFFSCLPMFITEGNCKGYGIDEEAVRAYNTALTIKSRQ